PIPERSIRNEMRHGETGSGSVYHANAPPLRSLLGATVASMSQAVPTPGTIAKSPRIAFVRSNEPGGVQFPASAIGAANSRMTPAYSVNVRMSLARHAVAGNACAPTRGGAT